MKCSNARRDEGLGEAASRDKISRIAEGEGCMHSVVLTGFGWSLFMAPELQHITALSTLATQGICSARQMHKTLPSTCGGV